jgi:hypothetical protein
MCGGQVATRQSPSFVKKTVADHQVHHEHAKEIAAFEQEVRRGGHPYGEAPYDFVPFSPARMETLRPSQLDWENSKFKQLWGAPLQIDLPPLDWEVAIEVLSEHITQVLIQDPTLRSGQPARRSVIERYATETLSAKLRLEPDMTKQSARDFLNDQGLVVSRRVFENRVWPAARVEASLPARAAPGRKKKPR